MAKKAEYKLKSFENKAQIAKAIKAGTYTESELRREYTKLRNQIVKQIKRTQASDIPYLPGKAPTPPTIKELTGPLGVNMQQMIYEAGQMVKLLHSKGYTRAGRVAQRKEAVAQLRKHGINIDIDDWGKWRRFMEWFKHTEFSALYDSSSEVTLDVFAQGSNAAEWEKLFKEWSNRND